MAGNSFGSLFNLTTFGESHGLALGGIIDGCPAGLEIDETFVQNELARRRPGQSHITTQRKEEDQVKFLSGIFEGKTTGTSIGFIIENSDQRSQDYEHIKDVFRPSHADYTYHAKYGIRDHRGGGRSSARETACRIVAGAIAKLLLKHSGITIRAFVSTIGKISVGKPYFELDLDQTENNIVRCPDKEIAEQMIVLIEKTAREGDTLGGIISCVVKGTPPGLGEPVFDKLNADLAKAMLSINAVKGFELGTGFSSVTHTGSELNDEFFKHENTILSKSNNSGGIQGGISNGQDIYFNVAFKPVATIMKDQHSVNEKGEDVIVKGKGRHDPCVVPRAVPIVESMAALVMADHLLRARASKL